MTQEINRFEPPRSNVADREPIHELSHAGNGRRLGTLLVDYACYFLLSFVFGAAIALLFGKGGIQALQSIPSFLLGAMLLIAFYLFFEGIWRRTPGKFLFGTIVVSEDGQDVSFRQLVTRTLCRFIPFEPFSFLGSRGWHDGISKTHVVLIRKP